MISACRPVHMPKLVRTRAESWPMACTPCTCACALPPTCVPAAACPPAGDKFESLVDPNYPSTCSIKRNALNVHGITDAMVTGCPASPQVVLALLAWIYQRCREAGGARPTLVGHNIRGWVGCAARRGGRAACNVQCTGAALH